ncbi:MAG: L-fuculose-phosphate aldolase [Desulfobacteraceae bacterium]|nr:L-fuculose-phosphate aldolase [Desulfobacteraceae bacterium]
MRTDEEQIIHFGRQMITAGLTTGTGGNLSVVNREEGFISITPSGVPYAKITPQQIAVIGFDGLHRCGTGKPSSETAFHLALYKARPDIRAVVHTHSVYATTFACLGEEIPAVHYLVGFCGYKVPVAPYATFGTAELADNICRAIGDVNAVLLENHGLVAVGKDLPHAFAVAEEIELVSRIYYQARCIGTPKILPDTEMKRVLEKFKSYGS